MEKSASSTWLDNGKEQEERNGKENEKTVRKKRGVDDIVTIAW